MHGEDGDRRPAGPRSNEPHGVSGDSPGDAMKDAFPLNRSIWLTTAVLGTALAVAGFHHGFFEALQGNAPTPGAFINSIGPDRVRWEHGTDPAFTVIPNFLLTGLASMAVSIAIAVWSFTGLRRPHGPTVLLTLFVLLTLVGGGVGHILFFLAVWAYSTRVRRPPAPSARRLGRGARRVLAASWTPMLFFASALFLIGLELSVFGAGSLMPDPDRLLAVDWGILLAAFVCLNMAYLGAMARDAAGPGLPDG